MFVLRDKRTGKYLKSFSGSFARFKWRTAYRSKLREEYNEALVPGVYADGRSVAKKEQDARTLAELLFCLPSPVGAKVYATKAGIHNSLGAHRRLPRPKQTSKGLVHYEAIPLSESHPWLEILPVSSIVIEEKK